MASNRQGKMVSADHRAPRITTSKLTDINRPVTYVFPEQQTIRATRIKGLRC